MVRGNNKNTSPLHFASSQGQPFTHNSSTFSSPRTWGMGHCGQPITAPLCCFFLLTHFPTPAWALHWEQENPQSFTELPSTFKFGLAILCQVTFPRQTPDKLSNAVRRVNQVCLMRLRSFQRVTSCPSTGPACWQCGCWYLPTLQCHWCSLLAWSQGWAGLSWAPAVGFSL